MVILNIDYNKCKEVVEIISIYFQNKTGIANIDCPSNISYKTNEYYLYMFYSCLLDYGMRSKIYHRNLINTYIKYPNIFQPNYVIEISEERLKDIIINNIHPRYPNIAIKKWLTLSNELIRYKNISDYLKSINSFEELSRFIKNTKSYGQKTGGLLMRVICDTEICNFKENIKSIPIDRHDIEISYLTGIINTLNISNKEIIELSDTYVKIGKALNVNPSNIDKYLWKVGNLYCNKKNCEECPLNNICIKNYEVNI